MSKGYRPKLETTEKPPRYIPGAAPFEQRTWCEDCIGEKRHCPYNGKHPEKSEGK